MQLLDDGRIGGTNNCGAQHTCFAQVSSDAAKVVPLHSFPRSRYPKYRHGLNVHPRNLHSAQLPQSLASPHLINALISTACNAHCMHRSAMYQRQSHSDAWWLLALPSKFHYAWYIRPRPLPNSRYLSRPTLSITLQSRLCKQPSSRYARQHSAHCHHHHRRRLLLFPAGPQSSSILQHQAS